MRCSLIFGVSFQAYLLPLLLSQSVGDGVLDGGARTLVDHRIPKRDLQEARDHQDQVRCVTQGDRHAPIVLRCRTQSEKKQTKKTHIRYSSVEQTRKDTR